MKSILLSRNPELFLCSTLGLLLAASPTVFAAGVVTNCTEADLRAAMVDGGTVTFACEGTITLSSTVVVTNDTTLDATGRAVAISGGSAVRLFQVESNVSFTLRSLTLADGMARGTNGVVAGSDGGSGEGGAIYNQGLFSAGNCAFLQNVAVGGNGALGLDAPWTITYPGDGGIGTGGAIYNQNGQVSLTNCTLKDNRAVGGTGGLTSMLTTSLGGDSIGGAIYSTGGQVFLVNCLVNSNRSVSGRGYRFGTSYSKSGMASAGAIEIAGGELTLQTSVLVGNWSQVEHIGNARGGAMTQTGGFLRANDCVFRENSVTGGFGLGIAHPAGQPGGSALGGALCLFSGGASFENSTFLSNLVTGGGQHSGNSPGAGTGGAVFSLGNLHLLNCTVFGNTAKAGTNGAPGFQTGIQGGAFGGGLHNDGGTINLVNTTISDNAVTPSPTNANYNYSAVAQGGGIYSVNGTANLLNTIVANSLSGSNGFGTLVDLGHNLSSDSSCNFTNTGSLNNTDPVLGPLADYGGHTPTMPLLSGSPAIDGGNPTNHPPTDQRGRTRPYGPASDIGAYESSPPFVIRGQVSGFTLADEVQLAAGAGSTMTTNRGAYSLEALAPGERVVTPASADYLFVPDSHLVTVGPDQLGVNFKAYHWNALSLDEVSGNLMKLVYAGINGRTVRLLASSNLFDWFAVSTNTIGSSQLLEFQVPVSPESPKQFYRMAEN